MEKSDMSRSRARGAVSMTDLRTPIVENFLSMLPMGHEKALKNAFYNVLALVITAVVIAASWTVYCILEPFFKPLLWALLVGTVLHPFKANLSSWTRQWLKSVKKSSCPLALHLVLAPFTVADALSDQIGNYVWVFWKSILTAVGVFLVTYIFYYNPPVQVATFIQCIVSGTFSLAYWILSWFNWQIVFTLNVVYIGYLIHSILQRRGKPPSNDTPVGPEEKENVNLNSSFNQGGDETDLTKTPETFPPTQGIAVSEQKSHWTKTLSYGNFIVTIFFISLQLPTVLLIGFLLFVLVGIVSFLRAQPSGSKYNIATMSRKAIAMVRSIGNGQGRAEPESCPMASQILSPKRGGVAMGDFVKQENVSPVNSESDNVGISPRFNSSNCPGAESTFSEDKKFNRRWSEGSGHSFRPTSFEQKLGEQASPKSMPSPILDNTELDADEVVDGNYLIDSNKFLYGVLCACVVVQVWNRLWLLHLLPIPVVYYAIKKLGTKLGIDEYYNRRIKTPLIDFWNDLQDPASEGIFPTPIRLGIKILAEADKEMVSFCEAYLDPVVASLVLIFVVIGTILGLIFAAIQVYGEGDHLVRVSVNLINTTVSEYPEINKVLPDGWESIMDTMVGNAYVHGKEYITNMIRDSVSDKNPEKAEQIEHQVIELWDRIYLAWNQTWDNAALKTPSESGGKLGHGIEWDELLETGKEMPQLLEMSVLANYAKANVGTIWAIMESLWNILIGNISLVVSAVTAVLSLLFGGGTAILNLVLNLVVFFTALFYILRSKSSTYKPVELFNRYAPGTGQHTKKLATAVEEAVNGVFTASFKMAAFYGMWTWLIHTLFDVNIVFIPSIFGALFGAVPILGPYWAAVPAVLELWLIQGHRTNAILMFCAQMAPMSVVDTQIYREIKGGGHPYLTGLAVAGGIFCFGFQGAIMGPLVLCCFFVAMKIGNNFLRDGNGTELDGTAITRRIYQDQERSHRQHATPPIGLGSTTAATVSPQSPLLAR